MFQQRGVSGHLDVQLARGCFRDQPSLAQGGKCSGEPLVTHKTADRRDKGGETTVSEACVAYWYKLLSVQTVAKRCGEKMLSGI